MAERKTCNLDVPVTPTTKKALQTIAQRDDVSLAHVIRKAVKEMLAKETSDDQTNHP